MLEEVRGVIRKPGAFEELLIDWGLRDDRRRRIELVEREFRALGEAAVPPLIEALKDENLHVRWYAATRLGKIGPAAKEAVPALIAARRNTDEDFMPFRSDISLILEALANIGPASKEAVPVLIELLKDEAQPVRETAAAELGKIGSGAKEAVPALTEALKDGDARVRGSAKTALWKIKSATAPPD